MTGHIRGSRKVRLAAPLLAIAGAAFIAACDSKVPVGPGTVSVTQTTTTTTITTVPPSTRASFVASPSSTAVGQQVGVNASGSTAAPGRTLVTYSWNFGDGTFKTGVVSSHDYDAPGTYTITLTITDDGGQRATTSQQVVIGGALATSTIAAPITSAAVRFVGVGGPAAPPNIPADMTLLFQQIFSASPSAAFQRRGFPFARAETGSATYRVTGTFTTPSGMTGQVEGQLVGTLTPLNGQFTGTLTANTPGCSSLRQFSGPIGSVVNWTGGAASGTCGSSNPLITFETFDLVKSDQPPPTSTIATTTIATTTTVAPPLVLGAIAAAPTGTGLAAATVYTFQIPAPSGGVPPYTYSWSFGDGSATASGNFATHTFSNTGTFPVILTVTDSGGRTAQTQTSVSIATVTGMWFAEFDLDTSGVPDHEEPIALTQNQMTVSGTINDLIDGQNRFASGSGAVANPRALSISFTFSSGPGTPFSVTYIGSFDTTLSTWTGTATGYGGCTSTPCSFTATQTPLSGGTLSARGMPSRRPPPPGPGAK